MARKQNVYTGPGFGYLEDMNGDGRRGERRGNEMYLVLSNGKIIENFGGYDGAIALCAAAGCDGRLVGESSGVDKFHIVNGKIVRQPGWFC